jgi:hypothetical protein
MILTMTVAPPNEQHPLTGFEDGEYEEFRTYVTALAESVLACPDEVCSRTCSPVPYTSLVTQRTDGADRSCHNVWESHMRGIESDFVPSWQLDEWLRQNIRPSQLHADAISIHEIWLLFCDCAKLYCSRANFGNVLARIASMCFRWWPAASCRCSSGPSWGHVHCAQLVRQHCATDFATLEHNMKDQLTRKRFEVGGDRPVSGAKRQRCAAPLGK